MQKVIAALLKKLSDKGLDQNEIAIYLQGLFDGMQIICVQLQSSKVDSSQDPDPIFAHNWNFIIDSINEIVESTIEEAYQTTDKNQEE